ncbi:MAG: Uma2 family endonuclease [Planctomycetaceae bacterium]|jgi:Uma2 family endonuclease|nr:Uma2 family endonuclease [Planctomycetaceae bacterium]
MSSADKLEHNSVEEYLQREANSLIKSEYIDGWIRAMTGASNRHNRIKIHCLIQLGNQLQGRKCQPFDSDTKVRITQDAGRRFYYPDVQVVCDSNDQLSVYQDHPVLIIEVLSPSTRAYDLHEKLDAYLSIPSLQCYIVLEQHQPISYVMRRSNQEWIKEINQGLDATIQLPFLSCSLSLKDIYEGIEFTETCVQEPDPEYACIQEGGS